MQTELRAYITGLLADRVPDLSAAAFTSVGGGSINEAFRIGLSNKKFFCKINSARTYPALFEKEASGLQAIRDTGCILTPGLIGTYYWNDQQILLLEWIEGGARTTGFWKLFGEQLAKMHLWKDENDERNGHANTFGSKHDNYMGALHQLNDPKDNWCDFFRENRLKPQLELAARQQLLPTSLHAAFDNLYNKLPVIFSPEPASFLHGDLWSGNFMCNASSEPVLIDPAVYYGHRSMDLAMTTLFGGFDKGFYDAYAYWYPFPSNYQEQWDVCNLYPLLIHLNLFGKSYLSSIESSLRRFH